MTKCFGAKRGLGKSFLAPGRKIEIVESKPVLQHGGTKTRSHNLKNTFLKRSLPFSFRVSNFNRLLPGKNCLNETLSKGKMFKN